MSDLLIDISNNNGKVLFGPLPEQGVKGVFAKATQGAMFLDKYFAYNRASAERAKLPFGAYHFFDPQTDSVTQANHFCAAVQKLNKTDLRPALDFEQGGLPSSSALIAIKAFGQVVKDKLGVYPLFYSFSSFLNALELPKTVGDGLWLADYGADDGVHEFPYETPKPWKKVVLHQFTDKGKLHGVSTDVDLNYAPRGLAPLYAHPWLMRHV